MIQHFTDTLEHKAWLCWLSDAQQRYFPLRWGRSWIYFFYRSAWWVTFEADRHQEQWALPVAAEDWEEKSHTSSTSHKAGHGILCIPFRGTKNAFCICFELQFLYIRCCNTREMQVHLNFLLICLYGCCVTVISMCAVLWTKIQSCF